MYFLFGLVKLIFRLPKSEEYLPEGLPGIFKFCGPFAKFLSHSKHIANYKWGIQHKYNTMFQNGFLHYRAARLSTTEANSVFIVWLFIYLLLLLTRFLFIYLLCSFTLLHKWRIWNAFAHFAWLAEMYICAFSIYSGMRKFGNPL